MEKVKFRKEESNGFYSVLKARVNELLAEENKRADFKTAAKVALLSASWFSLYAALYFISSVGLVLICYILLGALTTMIVLNIVHEAMHNALFKNNSLNKVAAGWLDLLGSDSYIWKRRHLCFHHSYPNIPGSDIDIQQTPLLRIIPNSNHKAFQSWQPVYAPFLYLFFSINWFFHRDFRDAFVNDSVFKITTAHKIQLIIKKLFYIFYIWLLPCYFSNINPGIALIGILIMHFTTSVIAVLGLTTAHVSHDSEFPLPDENGLMPDTWATHQVRVTQDFATDNFLVNAVFGGFNFHVAHHLFPSIPHRHYKKITNEIVQAIHEYNLDYKYKCKPLGEALLSHYRLLLNNSKVEVEIDM